MAGKFDSGFDPDRAAWLAQEVKKVADTGTQVVIMVGGGNFMRGAQIAGHGIKRVTADHMGMLGTMMNALALTDVFEAQGVKTRCLSNIFAEQVAEKFIHRLAEKHLGKGRVVIVAGGIGRPYLTTDTAAVSLALELDCDVVLKTTKVDGVYNKDPSKYDDAVKYDTLTFDQVLDEKLGVMDLTAICLCRDHNVPLQVFDMNKAGSLLSVVMGEKEGTHVTN